MEWTVGRGMGSSGMTVGTDWIPARVTRWVKADAIRQIQPMQESVLPGATKIVRC